MREENQILGNVGVVGQNNFFHSRIKEGPWGKGNVEKFSTAEPYHGWVVRIV
jgi:hypothetical protein